MFAVFVCLLPLVGALPTNYAQNISLAYVGDAISNLDTVNEMTVVDPAVADPLKNAIAAAWPDYYSHLVNPNEPTTTMSPEDAAWFTQTNLVNFWVDFHNETGVTAQPGGPLLSPTIGENGTSTVNGTLGGTATGPLGASNSSGIVDTSPIVTVSPIGSDVLNTTIGPIIGDLNITNANGTTGVTGDNTLLPGRTAIDPLLAGTNGTVPIDGSTPTVDGQNGTLLANGSFPILRDSVAGITGIDDQNTTMNPLMSPLNHLNDSSIALDPAAPDHLNDTSITMDHALGSTSTIVPLLDSTDPLALGGTTIVPHLDDGSTTDAHLLDDGTGVTPMDHIGDHPLDDHPLEGGTSPVTLGDMTSTVVPIADGAMADAGTTIPHDGTTLLANPADGHATTMGIPTSF